MRTKLKLKQRLLFFVFRWSNFFFFTISFKTIHDFHSTFETQSAQIYTKGFLHVRLSTFKTQLSQKRFQKRSHKTRSSSSMATQTPFTTTPESGELHDSFGHRSCPSKAVTSFHCRPSLRLLQLWPHCILPSLSLQGFRRRHFSWGANLLGHDYSIYTSFSLLGFAIPQRSRGARDPR